MSHTDVDRVNGKVIRKLHSPKRDKTFGYLLLELGSNGDVLDLQEFSNLTEARKAAGFVFAIASKTAKRGRK